MPTLPPMIDKAWQELRRSRRLQLVLLAFLLLAVAEGGLRWNDRLAARERQLQQLRSELRTLRAQSRDEAALRQSLDALAQARRDVETRLWRVSSEAIGQARVKDWLESVLKRAGAARTTLTLAAAKPFAAADKEGVPAELRALQEIRATVTFAFAPAVLEDVLAAIEAGEAFATIEALAVSRRDRRVDMTLRVLTRVAAAPAETPGETPRRAAP